MPSQRRPIYLNPAPTTASGVPSASASVQAFHESFPGYAASPLVALPTIAHELGVRAVYVKQESDRFGLPAFKVLGASWAIYRAVTTALGQPSDTPLVALVNGIRTGAAAGAALTLIAATEGNHGRAVARVAQQMGLRCRIYVPHTMHEYTRQMIRSEGADLEVVDGDYDRAVQTAATAATAAPAAPEGAPNILIQDTAFAGYEEIPGWIVEGYSTLLREADAQLHAVGLQSTLVVAPVGVGSFAHAVAASSKSRESPAAVVTVEPDTAATLTTSLRRGVPTSVATSPSIMAGMNCGTVSTTAWPQLHQLVDASVTVSDWESHCAVQQLAAQSVDSGPCGAASLAAIRRLKAEHDTERFFAPDSVILLLSTEGPRPYAVPVDVSPDDPVELTQVLTRINSSNPTLSQSEGAGETAIVNYLSACLTTYEGDALSGHQGMKDGEEVVFGRGALDMKAGLAAGLSALLVAQRTPLSGDVLVAAVADEEDSSQGDDGWTGPRTPSNPAARGLGHGRDGACASVPFWCDAALLTAAGIPSIVFGPSGGGLHAKEEWVTVDNIRAVTGVLGRLIRQFCP
ncbi:tryptophan synthase beta subunit-like PLP-dependent enzyme [Aspergillus heteromorphus CBS 117.55]|uniref:Tryptophan synthase beta subunit-like PLP-dependent enzyme n=1 Tax=Aspergillus heteromorphus CBS 117.55 TaxID=1448321 RepID=A0A317WDA5_9EURO|nr:tryptophan synthase beta subunit-like PLP-dependent enzyme [Aspergillus heteromorphus CBS 117.55]PWY83337.1 tryptophan synthase beta subunit-like PLP-dependent enzyme [Aspergillus heteromorphus CBS 117.55]